jgi:hypothetical protein
MGSPESRKWEVEKWDLTAWEAHLSAENRLIREKGTSWIWDLHAPHLIYDAFTSAEMYQQFGDEELCKATGVSETPLSIIINLSQ